MLEEIQGVGGEASKESSGERKDQEGRHGARRSPLRQLANQRGPPSMVNNAGLGVAGRTVRIHDMTEEDWDMTM